VAGGVKIPPAFFIPMKIPLYKCIVCVGVKSKTTKRGWIGLELKERFKRDFLDLLMEHKPRDLIVFPILDEEDDNILRGYRYKCLDSNFSSIRCLEGFLGGARHVLTNNDIFEAFNLYKSEMQVVSNFQ
jgi:hypothetical protein